jgi:hypothetical protein
VVVQDVPPPDAAVVCVKVRFLVAPLLLQVVELPHVDHDPVQVPQLPQEPTHATAHDEVEQVFDCTLPASQP